MKTSQKKALLVIGIIFLVSFLNFFIPTIYDDGKYLILLFVVLGLLYYLIGIKFNRNANDFKVIKNILIYVVAYYVIIYFAGFFIGFARTIYSYRLSNLVLNIIPSILYIILVEVIRGELIFKTNKNKFVLISSCITFILLDISVNFIGYDLNIQDSLYLFIGLLVIPSVMNNILLTVMHTKTDKYPAILYRLLTETLGFLLLIEPDLGPYVKSVGLIILPVLLCYMLLSMEKKVQDAPKKAKDNRLVYGIIILVLLVLVLLNSGLIKYHTLVIGSDSMRPYMAKGDVILIEHTKNTKKINKGDILVFNYDNKIVAHRVIYKGKRDGVIYYKTKGDNNDQDDLVLLSTDQIKGKVLLRIKYIGLPSVWLNSLFD